MTTTGLVLPPPGAGGAGEAVHRAECRWPPAAAGAHRRGYGGITDRRRAGHDSENTRSTCAFRGNPLRPSVGILMDVRVRECHGGSMSTIGGSAERAGWAGESAVLAAVCVALVPMGALHVLGSTAVDPVGVTISDYVAVPGGYPMLGLSSLALGAAGLLLVGGVRAARLPHARTVTALLVAWSAALLVVAVFPTNHPGTPVTVSSWVHRLGGAVVFGVLPVIVALVARHAGDAEHWAPSVPALRAWAVLSGSCTVVFLAVQVPVAFGSAPALPGIGLLQRLLFALVVALLVVLARAVHAAAGSAQTVHAAARPAPVALAPVRGECGGAA